jgi:hypothetical protein
LRSVCKLQAKRSQRIKADVVAPWQVLVYFAVAKKGDAPTDGKTDVNPEGLTAACGPHAAAVAARLHAAGLSCKVSCLCVLLA